MSSDRVINVEVLTTADALNAALARGDEYAAWLADSLRSEAEASRYPDAFESLGKGPFGVDSLIRFSTQPARAMPFLRQAAEGEGTRAAAACLALAWFGHWEFIDRVRELLMAPSTARGASANWSTAPRRLA